MAKYDKAKTELNYKNGYELLVAIVLSAQCTDKRVNIITVKLFEKYPDIISLSKAKVDDIKQLIDSCSFFNNKANNLLTMATQLKERYNYSIPKRQQELETLAGVGEKTACVYLIELYDANIMAVDTHVFRVSHRLGLSYAKTVAQTKIELEKKFETDLNKLHQAMVLFGRYICKAVKPDCDRCILVEFCKSKKSFKPS